MNANAKVAGGWFSCGLLLAGVVLTGLFGCAQDNLTTQSTRNGSSPQLTVSSSPSPSVSPTSQPAATDVGGAIVDSSAQTGGTAVVSAITVSPSNETTLVVPAPDGLNSAGFAYQGQLGAKVLLKNGVSTIGVNWSSSASSSVSVDATGLVTARPGASPGLVFITAATGGVYVQVPVLIKTMGLVSATLPATTGIPVSTRYLAIKAQSKTGSVLDQSLPPFTGATLSANFSLDAQPIDIVASAYDKDPTAGGVALADASLSVNLLSNTAQPAMLVFTPRFVPAVTADSYGNSLSGLTGPAGGTMTITGNNFGFSRATAFAAYCGNELLPLISRASESQAVVSVPADATNGVFRLVVDGIASAAGTLKVQRSIVLGAVPSNLARGSTSQLAFTIRDSAGQPIVDARPTWSVSNYANPASPAPASIDQRSGLLSGTATGIALVTVSSGPLQATASVTIQ